MASEILLNNEIYYPSIEDLPCLITYGEKVGGSHFSISLVANLFFQGFKILILTAYPMARDNFLEQIKGQEAKVVYATNEAEIDSKAQVIILESGNEQLYLRVVENLNDLSERIVLIKNMEVFSEAVLYSCLKLEKVILSGDIDRCLAKEKIITKSYNSIVAFTKPVMMLPFELPVLEKYSGYLWSYKNKGIVTVKI